MEEEDEKCRKLHGYVSSSEAESEPDDSKFELDKQFEIFKPPPLNINPAKDKIIIVGGTVPTKLSKGQKKRLRKKKEKLLTDIVSSTIASTSKANESCDKQQMHCDNHPNYCDNFVYEKEFPSLKNNTENCDKLIENAEQEPERKKRSGRKSKQKPQAVCVENFNNHFYYAYDRSDLENFNVFKDHYLNGSISVLDGNEKNKDTNIKQHVPENINWLLNYLDNVCDLFNILYSFAQSDKYVMYNIEDLANCDCNMASFLRLHHQQYDFSEMYETTMNYIRNLVQLGIQHNYALTKEHIYYIQSTCALILQIASLYNDFYKEYKAIFKHIFLINEEFSDNPNDIALINYLSDVVCILMKNVLCDMKEPMSVKLIFTSIGSEDEEFVLLYDNLHLVVTDYIEKTLQNVKALAEAMGKSFNLKHGFLFTYSREREIRTRKTCIMDIPMKLTEKLVSPCVSIDNFWTRNKYTNFQCTVTDKDKKNNGSVSVDTKEVPSDKIQTDSSQRFIPEFGVKSIQNADAKSLLRVTLADKEDSSQTKLYQSIIIRDLTENRKYFYDGNYENYEAKTWRKFQIYYLNEVTPNNPYKANEFERITKNMPSTQSQRISPKIFTSESLQNLSSVNAFIVTCANKNSSEIHLYQSNDLTKKRKYLYDDNHEENGTETFQSSYLNKGLDVYCETEESETDSIKVESTQGQKIPSKVPTSEFHLKYMENIDAENSFNVQPEKEDSSQVQLYRPIVSEDLTENLKDFRDDDDEVWTFQSPHFNQVEAKVCSDAEELESDTHYQLNSINEFLIPSWAEHNESMNTNCSNVIQDETSFFSDSRDLLKLLILYLLLKQPWFLNLVVAVIVAGLDIIVLISLLVYLAMQFVINC